MSDGLTRPKRQFGHGQMDMLLKDVLRSGQYLDADRGIVRITTGFAAGIVNDALEAVFDEGPRVVIVEGVLPGAPGRISQIGIFTNIATLDLYTIIMSSIRPRKRISRDEPRLLLGSSSRVWISPHLERQAITAIQAAL